MERKKLLAIVVSLSVLLSIPLVLSSGLVDISPFSFTPESNGTPSVFAVPTKNITDYEDPDHDVTIGSTVTFHVNISDVTDLYTWHVNMSWNKDILNGSQIVYGDFLAGTTSPNGTSAGVANITGIFNEDGYGWVAESVLAEYPGVDGNGALLEIQFEIVGYGCSELNISILGDLPTELLDSTGNNMTFTTADGYFRNKRTGDANGDTSVNVFDILNVKHHWYPGPPVGAGGYERNVDINDDGSINVFDILLVKNNWDW